MSNIFKQANEIAENNTVPMSTAIEIASCIDMMRSGNVHFRFLKKDGSVREAVGTLQQEVVQPTLQGSGKELPKNLVAFYDTEKEAWRSFDVRRWLGYDE
ncbi:MAG: DUF2693 domain-containing protein [Bacteroidaceae bacterium]|nr:DUF2693 domain-containing protein [Bacteroidaceae bacterium]